MSFEEAPHDPLTNVEPYTFDKFFDSGVVYYHYLTNRLSEEHVKGVQRVLVHPVYNI